MAIFKRARGYTVVIDVTTTGRRKRRSVGTFATRRDAERAEREALSSRDRGIDVAPATVTVAELFDRFFRDAAARISPKTRERYEMIERRSIRPTLGPIAVAKLKPAHLSELYASLLANGRARGGGLSPRTVGHVAQLVRTALAWGVRMELAGRNVALLVDPPKAERSDAAALSVDEVQRLLEATVNARLGPLFAFALATGMRRGEIAALRWEAVDMQAESVVVNVSASWAYGTVTDKSPKSGRTRRVSLSAMAVEALRVQKVRQAEHRLAVGGIYKAQGFVFADEIGDRIHPRSITAAFAKVAKRLKLSTTSFHALRHTAATWMIGGGVDVRTAAAVLGHANANITLSTYAHVIAGAEASAVSTIERRLKAKV
jgi:integrase